MSGGTAGTGVGRLASKLHVAASGGRWPSEDLEGKEMHGISRITALIVIGASALAVGCGRVGGANPIDVPKAQAGCVSPKLASPGRTFIITERDNGKSFCIVSGTGVFVFLHGSPTRMWTQIQPSSAALQPRPSGEMSLMRGVTGGYFVATRFGHATLSSSRGPCRFRTGSAMPATSVGCTTHSYFKVTLVVRGAA